MTNKDKLEERKKEALVLINESIEKYKNDYYDPKLTDAILKKKSKLILNSTTVEEIKKILSGPIPFDDSEITVPEEEIILWSQASLKAPLNTKAFNRYLYLLKNIYGSEIVKQIIN